MSYYASSKSVRKLIGAPTEGKNALPDGQGPFRLRREPDGRVSLLLEQTSSAPLGEQLARARCYLTGERTTWVQP